MTMTDLEPLRVLLLAGRYEPRGSCEYSLRLLEHLSASQFEPEMVCASSARVPAARRERLRIREFPGLRVPLLRRWATHRIARDWPVIPSLLHVQTREMAAMGARLALIWNIPSVLTVHDFPAPGSRLPAGARSGGIIAVSEAVRDHLVQHALAPAEQIQIVASGVEPQHWRPPQRPPNHRLVVGTATSLEPVKGLPVFLRAARRVLDEYPAIEFVVAGSGPEERPLRNLARELGVDSNLTFATHLQDSAEALAAFDIFVLPSLQQALGTIMLDAMARCIPVIATRAGGVESVVRHDEHGLLVARNDDVAMARAILSLVRNPDLATRLAKAAHQLVVERYDVAGMVRATAAVYRRAAARCRPSQHSIPPVHTIS